jgi:hypothetical protein
MAALLSTTAVIVLFGPPQRQAIRFRPSHGEAEEADSPRNEGGASFQESGKCAARDPSPPLTPLGTRPDCGTTNPVGMACAGF